MKLEAADLQLVISFSIEPSLESLFQFDQLRSTHLTEKQPRHLVCIVFWSGMASNVLKMPIFGQKYKLWAKFGLFGSNIFLGRE